VNTSTNKNANKHANKNTNAQQLLIGIHPVAAALNTSPELLVRLIIAEESGNPRVLELEQQARTLGIQVERHPRSFLDRRCDGERHQDVLADYTANNVWAERDLDKLLLAIAGPPLILVLDGVQDPHNLGACLRTAEAAGVHLVIVPKDRSAALSPVARRAASGAAEIIDIAVVTNLARVLRKLKDQGIWLAAAADQAEKTVYATDLTGPIALVMGGEGQGLRRLTEELCDYHVRIPMHGMVSSLNVSVATAICIYEIIRQRNAP
jgi:23S rRNA (guanosine2251-2'-O)-methyltransferase